MFMWQSELWALSSHSVVCSLLSLDKADVFGTTLIFLLWLYLLSCLSSGCFPLFLRPQYAGRDDVRLSGDELQRIYAENPSDSVRKKAIASGLNRASVSLTFATKNRRVRTVTVTLFSCPSANEKNYKIQPKQPLVYFFFPLQQSKLITQQWLGRCAEPVLPV